MKLVLVSVLALGGLLSLSGMAQDSISPVPGQNPVAGAILVADRTPAQQRIEAAKRQLAKDPRKVQAFNELANAYLRRARESSDSSYLKDAEDALSQGIKIEPNDFQLLKSQVALTLARHEYSKAREQATVLNHRTPDDAMTYGFLAEADIAIGDYKDAVNATQWMLNLQRNNVPGLLLGAQLREIYGNPHGAIDYLNLAYSETSPDDPEELAFIANQTASVQINSGQADAADHALEHAERLFPNYAPTEENLARVRLAEQRGTDAVGLLIKARNADANPVVVFELAKALDAAGQHTEALKTYKEFEALATSEASRTGEATLDLILIYAADASTASKALNLAQSEIGLRHDLWTEDAYARALYANGKFDDADTAVKKALATGIQNAQILDHAGHIEEKLGKHADATKLFQQAIEANPWSADAQDARTALGMSTDRPLQAAKTLQTSAGAQISASTDSVTAHDDRPQTDGDSAPIDSANDEHPKNLSFAPVPEALLIPAPTETEHQIKSAQASVARNPKDVEGYTGLGAAHYQRARETGDVNDFELAEQSLSKSLDLDSGDFAAETAFETMAEVCMGEHRFTDALSFSHKALSLGSGDVSPFAIVGDAYADMGEYEKAGQAYERLSPPDMTLGPRAAYARDSRIAYLKFIGGNTAQAIDLMKKSVAEGVEAQLPSENLAWLYFELGEFYAQSGNVGAADAAYLTALRTHPGDYRALAGLGKLRASQGRYDEAAQLYQRAIAVVPMPLFVAELGDLYAKQGNQAEAKKQYQLVEYIGLLGHINQVLHNRDLALFYADHDIKLPEALDLARKEFEVRHDIYTWDALAWALYKNGKYDEALKASEKALQFGTRDALLLYHAGAIAERAGRVETARNELRAALKINPHFNLLYSDAAQHELASLDAQANLDAKGDSHAR